MALIIIISRYQIVKLDDKSSPSLPLPLSPGDYSFCPLNQSPTTHLHAPSIAYYNHPDFSVRITYIISPHGNSAKAAHPLPIPAC